MCPYLCTPERPDPEVLDNVEAKMRKQMEDAKKREKLEKQRDLAPRPTELVAFSLHTGVCEQKQSFAQALAP